MSDSISIRLGGGWWGVLLALFLAIKIAGTTLASWSWWWIFFPIIPLLGILVQKVGL